MKVLCALGLRNGPALLERATSALSAGHEWILLHVIDSGPRHGMEAYLRGNLLGPPEASSGILALQENAAAQATLREAMEAARRLGLTVRGEILRGRPEQLIVQAAHNAGAHLVVIAASEGAAGRPQIGPASVGRVARFVLDHAPCDVLLLRGSTD